MKLVSDATWYWFLVFLVASISIGWPTVDVVRLRKFFRRPPEERTHDELFGMIMGLLLAGVGGIGLLKHFMGW
jgi:hypothetical protein